jgi:hypothetical protein
LGQLLNLVVQAATQHGVPVTVSQGDHARGAVGTVSRPAGSGASGASDGSGPSSGKLPPPVKWSESSKGRKPATFLADAKEWLERSKYDPAASFHLLLEGKFREDWQVIRESYPNQSMSWDNVCTEFLKLTGADLIDDKRVARERLLNGKLKMEGSIQSYVVAIRAARNLLATEFSEDVWVDRFVAGLSPPEFQRACSLDPLTNKPWPSMASAIAYAVGHYERMHKSAPAPKLAVARGTSRRRPQAAYHQLGNALGVHSHSGGGGSGSGGRAAAAASSTPRKGEPGWRQHCMQNNLCFACGRGGHQEHDEECPQFDAMKALAYFRGRDRGQPSNSNNHNNHKRRHGDGQGGQGRGGKRQHASGGGGGHRSG